MQTLNEQIENFKGFIEQYYEKKLHEVDSKGISFIFIDFFEIAEHSPELAEFLLENPEDAIKALELSISEFDVNLKARIFNLPKSQFLNIKDIRSKHLDKFIYVEGIIRQASDIRPQVTSAKFECSVCGNTLSILQLDTKFKEPTRCSCGNRVRFKLLSKDLVDAQRLVIEESSENLEGGEQAKRLPVYLKEDLVEPKMEKKTTPGSKVRINGVIKEVPIMLKTGAKSVTYDLMIDANSVIPIEETYEEIEISKEEEQQIKNLAKDEMIYEKLINSIAPSIYGHEKIKEAIVLQLMSGVRKVKDDGTIIRGDMHILLVGDPGAAKSSLLQFVSKAAPKARFVSGKGSSLEYNEPLLIKENGTIKFVKMGEFIDSYYSEYGENKIAFIQNKLEALSINLTNFKTRWKPIYGLFRHKNNKKLYRLYLETGREITISEDHSIFVIEDGKITSKEASKLTKNDYVIIPKKMPIEDKKSINPKLSRLLGYYIAEGHLYCGKKKQSYKVEFTLNKNENELISDINNISKEFFGKQIAVYSHGLNGVRLSLHGKYSYEKVKDLLGEYHPFHAKEKRIPQIIFNSDNESRKNFIDTYYLGDAGTTKSQSLMSDLLYLYLQNGVIAGSCNAFREKEVTFPDGHTYKPKGRVFNLKSPHPKKNYIDRYSYIPISKINEDVKNYFLRSMIASKHTRAKFDKISNKKIMDRLVYLFVESEVSGKILRNKFGESVLEYFNENSLFFKKIKEGREVIFSLTKKGKNLVRNAIAFKALSEGDIGFVRVKKIEDVTSNHDYIYDISVPEHENFVAGFGGIICHNSGAGLTASVIKDEFIRGWALEAGALVLANGGLCAIDELDKMSPEDRSAIHEALEQQQVSIAKANIQATLRAQTSVLAAANPKLGRFDPYTPIAAQIDLPPALINRFDLIFPVRDIPNRERDEKIASHVLELQKRSGKIESEINTKLLRKYIAYAKQNIKPILTDAAVDEIKKFYVNLRNKGQSSEEEIRPIPISARQLEALVRLSEASAKIRLSKEVKRKDARRAIDILTYCLLQVGIDPETGKIDIDRISTGITATQRSRIVIVREIIKELESKHGKIIPIEAIFEEATKKGYNEDQVEEALEKLKREAEIFSPKQNFVSRL